jgi:hypothetical protein
MNWVTVLRNWTWLFCSTQCFESIVLAKRRLYHIFVRSVALTICFCFDSLVAFVNTILLLGTCTFCHLTTWIPHRSEIAWKNANYAQILEYLREEYELNQRFGSLDFKLKFVEVSALCTHSSIVQNCFFCVFICANNLFYNSTTSIFSKKSSKIDGLIC